MKTSFICLMELLTGQPYFHFAALSDLAISLAVSLTIGSVEIIGGNVAIGSSR